MNNNTPLQQIIIALETEQISLIKEILNPLAPAEIARLLESLPPISRKQVWQEIEIKHSGEVLINFSGDVFADLVDEMTDEELLQATKTMDEDDLVDFLQDLPDAIALKVIRSFDELRRQKLIELIDYEEDSAGGLMNTDALAVRPESTIKALVRYLRRKEKLPNNTNKIFVVNRQGQLQGEILLTHLFTFADTKTIGEIMNKNPVSVSPDTEANQLSRLFREKDLVSCAVVNQENQLIGRITVDDVIDFMQEESDRLLMQTAGMNEQTDTFAPIHKAASSRGIWLGINMLTALITASVINAFDATIEKIVALAALAPLVASLGGNAGAQSLTIIIRGIALGHIEKANTRWLLFRELSIGIINGLFWGTIGAIIAFLWFNDIALSIILLSALFINLVVAAIFGAVIPLLLNKLGIDPALAGSIFLMTFTDIIGFFALLSLAHFFLL